MADNDKVRDPEDDPKVSTIKDIPEEVPNELPHHSWMIRHHGKIERNAFLLLVLSFLVVSIGGIVQIVPLFYLENTIEDVEGVRPYAPLELAGRNIYVREGCYVCHSQMIRPMRAEVERYGHYSLAAESQYDHPFQWGSKRTGPDLARVGGRYSDEWHAGHMYNPRDLVPESIMPSYPHLERTSVDSEYIGQMMETHRVVGVPYTDEMIDAAKADFRAQADPDNGDVDGLFDRYPGAQARYFDGDTHRITELDAVIAYLQMLGTLVDFSTFEPDQSRQGAGMETYTSLRAFADSWAMAALFLFFVGMVLWVFRPGSKKVHDDSANMIFRNEEMPKGDGDGRE